jgi:hypothetical protein
MKKLRRKVMEHKGCPRGNMEIGVFTKFAKTAKWDKDEGKRRCSYCGSLHPDDFMERVKAGEILTGTDKNYKVYIGVHDKFYWYHLSEDQMKEFVDLWNEKKLNLEPKFGIYKLPYFVDKKENK